MSAGNLEEAMTDSSDSLTSLYLTEDVTLDADVHYAKLAPIMPHTNRAVLFYLRS